MPAKQGGDDVGGGEEVDGAAEEGPGDSVEPREVPGYLRFVDGEVGGDGAEETLGG